MLCEKVRILTKKQPKSEQPKSEQSKSEQSKSEQPKSEQPKSKQHKSEKLKFPQITASSMELFFLQYKHVQGVQKALHPPAIRQKSKLDALQTNGTNAYISSKSSGMGKYGRMDEDKIKPRPQSTPVNRNCKIHVCVRYSQKRNFAHAEQAISV